MCLTASWSAYSSRGSVLVMRLDLPSQSAGCRLSGQARSGGRLLDDGGRSGKRASCDGTGDHSGPGCPAVSGLDCRARRGTVPAREAARLSIGYPGGVCRFDWTRAMSGPPMGSASDSGVNRLAVIGETLTPCMRGAVIHPRRVFGAKRCTRYSIPGTWVSCSRRRLKPRPRSSATPWAMSPRAEGR